MTHEARDSIRPVCSEMTVPPAGTRRSGNGIRENSLHITIHLLSQSLSRYPQHRASLGTLCFTASDRYTQKRTVHPVFRVAPPRTQANISVDRAVLRPKLLFEVCPV